MQYVGRAFDSVSKTWSSINPATLSGAIDVIVVEHPDGELACSPFHVRFGKFQILKPSQKKVEVIVNGQLTDIPMKLGDSGEAYFVFETLADWDNIPDELISSPVVSAASSPESKPTTKESLEEPDFLDINDSKIDRPTTPTPIQRINKKLTQKEIPSTVDNNGDLLLDIEGYKTNKNKVNDSNDLLRQLLHDELGEDVDLSEFVKEDEKGNIRIVNPSDPSWVTSPPNSPPMTSSDSLYSEQQSATGYSSNEGTPSISTDNTKAEVHLTGNTTSHYIKTIRLTSKQLKCLDLSNGENDLTFSVDKGRAIVTAKLFYWKWDDPIVISDIDGTITKSDALGHLLTMVGKDWTHSGVAKLFTEIRGNGYNIMYLTARTAGQSDSTRSYLRSIVQDGCMLPIGPVILSPDRTMAALRREVILKKPEVFKIACLKDMKALYFPESDKSNQDSDEMPTPFIAGFGNRITDALSYRTVGIPSSRIFTINPDGEVHMELLELAGYKSSYIHINELVDHFFPPVKKYPFGAEDARSISTVPCSPFGPNIIHDEKSFYRANDDKYTDATYWREPIPDVGELSDLSDESDKETSPTRGTYTDFNNKTNTNGTNGFFAKNSKTKQSTSFSEERNGTETLLTPRRGSDPDSIGQRMYLNLGSPLSSPVLKVQDLDHDNDDPEYRNRGEDSITNTSTQQKNNSSKKHSPKENSVLTFGRLSTHTPSNPEIQPVNVYNDGTGPVMDQLQLNANSKRNNSITPNTNSVSQESLVDANKADSQQQYSDPESSLTDLDSQNISDDEYEDEFDEDEF